MLFKISYFRRKTARTFITGSMPIVKATHHHLNSGLDGLNTELVKSQLHIQMILSGIHIPTVHNGLRIGILVQFIALS